MACRQRGAVLIAVLVCLTVLTLLIAAAVRTGLMQNQQAEVEARRVQAEWLVEAGIERAAAALRRSSDYERESWHVPAAEIGGDDDAMIEITTERVMPNSSRRRIVVRADYPIELSRRTSYSKSIFIDLRDARMEN